MSDIENNNGKYEMVDHPSHYQMYEEVVEMINKVAGSFVASMWCKWNGFKYRMRMGTKPDNPIEQELAKEKVYLDLYKKYKDMWCARHIDFNELTNDEKDYISRIYRDNKTDLENYCQRRYGAYTPLRKYNDNMEVLKD